jgi:two-component system response regulator HydG
LTAQILVVEDDDDTRAAVAGTLRELGHNVAPFSNARAALTALEERQFDVLVSDIRMPGTDGLQLCANVVGNYPDLPVVLMTAYGDSTAVVQGLRAGAVDFLPKPFSLDDLKQAIERALARRHESDRMMRLPNDVTNEDASIEGFIGASHEMLEIRRRIRQAALQQSCVLITGETGTGKELVARAIHENSTRRSGPFIAVNCAAIPSAMLESELFGHAAGAFTGAVRGSPGMFRAADGGTLFLDEVGAMPLEVQPRVMRAIEQHAVRAVGTVDEVPVDVRMLAATNRRLRDAVVAGEFRSDLHFRLAAFEIELPPLRARGDDISELVKHFVKAYSPGVPREFSAEALVALRTYAWPGNVRELENAVHAALAVCTEGPIQVRHLPSRILNATPSVEGAPTSSPVVLDSVERQHIERILHEAGGNRSEAARKLVIDRVTLYRKMKRYRVD